MAELASVRVVATSNEAAIDGGTPLPVIDGVQLAEGDDLLLTDQDDPARNGVYTVPAGGVAWLRRTDADTAAEFVPGMHLYVREGAIWGGSRWHFTNPSEPTLGVSILNFEAFARETTESPGVGLEVEEVSNTWHLGDSAVAAGEYTNPSLTIDAQGRIQGASTGTLATTFIDGLQLEWVTVRRIRVKAGSAYIPSLGRVLELEADIEKAQLVLTANTWYYVYLFENAGVADVEVVSTPPAAPYLGYARTKSGTPDDDSRRYLGAVYASATDTMRRFSGYSGGEGFVRWVADSASVRPLFNAQTTVVAQVDISAYCPPTTIAVQAVITLSNTDNASIFYVSAAGDGLQTIGAASGAGQLFVSTTPTTSSIGRVSGPIHLVSNDRNLYHGQTAGGASRAGTIDIHGYWEVR